MSEWPHDAIRTASLRYIRKHVVRVEEWRFTSLDALHPLLGNVASLGPKELPVVSCCVDQRRWYVMSTARVLGEHEGTAFDVSPLDIKEWHWGDFKHSGRTEVELMRLVVKDGTEIQAAYETGPASMAPIYYQRFWYVKYPVLHKLAV